MTDQGAAIGEAADRATVPDQGTARDGAVDGAASTAVAEETVGPAGGTADVEEPEAGTWQGYLAALDELDGVRRQAAAAVASQQRAASDAEVELMGVRRRIELQRSRLVDVAQRSGRPVPGLTPSDSDRESAAALVPTTVMDPTPAVNAALQGAWATLDAADGTLATVAQAPGGSGPLAGWPPTGRNALVYGWYAILTSITAVLVGARSGSTGQGQLGGVGIDLGLCVIAFVLGLVSVVLLFGPDRRGRKPVSVLLGALICAVPLVVGVLALAF